MPFCLALVATVLAAAPDAPDYEPQICRSAAAYRGAPLHPPLPASSLAGAAGDFDTPLDDALCAALEKDIEWILANTSAPGITAAVGMPDRGMWSTSRGLAITSPETPLAKTSYFHWASVGKAFTAVVVMQLAEEGKIAYADSLAKWSPDLPNAQAITIDHLLTHTSGLFSFNADLKFRGQLRYHSPQELIDIAARHGCAFCPGENWNYSNTGYVLLARIIEEIEGLALNEVIDRRILQPLRLEETIALAPKQHPAGLVVGHVQKKPDSQFEPTTPFGAGIIAGSARDMVRFWQALLAGELVPQATVVEAYARLYPMFQQPTYYGRGVMLYELPAGAAKRTWLGHSGGTPGMKTVVAYEPQSRIFVAVALNGDASAEACANKLLQTVTQFRAEP